MKKKAQEVITLKKIEIDTTLSRIEDLLLKAENTLKEFTRGNYAK